MIVYSIYINKRLELELFTSVLTAASSCPELLIIRDDLLVPLPTKDFDFLPYCQETHKYTVKNKPLLNSIVVGNTVIHTVKNELLHTNSCSA